MKKLIYPFVLAFLLVGCGNSENENISDNEATESIENTEGDAEANLLASNSMDPRTFGGDKNESQSFIDGLDFNSETNNGAVGSYVGDFGKNMITITIYEANDGIANGYSVCAGNFRKLDGTFEESSSGAMNFTLNEPGDDKYDGTFKFELVPTENVITGSWTPFKKEGNSSKEYTLNKKTFKYDPSVGKYPQASQRELTDDDLNNMLEEDLSEMRNEIYARHGYCFKNKDWRYHFEALDWYMPMGVDVRDKLTETEVVNIELIYEYESYFQDYYDDYGR